MLLRTHSSPRTIYVERLTLRWFWANVFFSLFTSRPGPVRILYFDCNNLALTLAKGMALCRPMAVEKIVFKSLEVVDKEGVSVRLKILYQELARLGTLIHKDMPRISEGRLDTYLLKAPLSSHDLYGDDKYRFLWQAVTLVNVVRWHIGKEATPSVELHLFERPFFNQLCEYAHSRGVNIYSMRPFHSKRKLLSKAGKLILKLNIKMAWALFRHAVVPRKNCAGTLPGPQAKLLAESRGLFNLNRQDLISDLFFIHKDAVCPQDILLVFNGTHDPVDEDKFKAMRGCGIQAVALTPQSSLVSPSQVGVFHVDKEKIFADDQTSEGGLPTDFKPFAAEYFQQRSFWKEFFTRNNVKLWTSFYKNEPLHIAMADALSAAGGISTIYQRSYESNPCPALTVGSDIIFGFSKDGYTIEKYNGSDFRYHITTGYLGDYRFGHLRAGAGHLRDRLARAGAKYIIAYFDENTINDERWFIGHTFAQDNYAFWLEKLLKNPSLGLIFKPKAPMTLRRRLGDVAVLLAKAESTGRCYVFEKGSVQSVFPPSAASLASDIAIHDLLAAGTAGLESFLAGTKTIMMDFEGWPRSPLYGLGDEVIFRSWENAWQACLEYFRDPLSHPKLGDWSAMIEELDSFHDGLAAYRMSCYLKELLEGLRRSEDRLNLMDRVAENYARRWGKDKVHRCLRERSL